MPILVQWKWKEQTKTFLVIFHFYDDYSKRNLRFKERKFNDGQFALERSTITWSPSHRELGLLGELLSYANIVNGLKEFEKRQLMMKLEGVSRGRNIEIVEPDRIASEIGRDKKIVFYVEEDSEKHLVHACAELCPEYIDYLKKILKPYLSD